MHGMKSAAVFLVATLSLIATATAAEPIRGTVTKIVDGDTVEILDDAKTTHRVRLHGVDAPERGAPFSRAARDHLAELVLRQAVTAHPVNRDRYGRTVARLDVRDTDVGLELLDAGMVWHWTRYDTSPAYAEAQRRARDGRRGLWADPRPVPPWEWRKMSADKRNPQ